MIAPNQQFNTDRPPGYPPGYYDGQTQPAYPMPPGGYPLLPIHGGTPPQMMMDATEPRFFPQQAQNVPLVPQSPPKHCDPESLGAVAGFDFTDESIRKGFIRKVYAILTLQLVVTFGVIALFVFHEETNYWVRRHPELSGLSFVVLIVTMIAMSCCDGVRRKSPMNYIFLGLFTLAQSFIMGVQSCRYGTDDVLMAVGITILVCVSLTLFAFQTKWDFTMYGGALFVAVIVLMVLGIVAIFIPGRTFHMVFSGFGAMLFSMYLVYDTQMMMGGTHRYSVSPEEYIFAVLNLYLDIVQIFMYTLRILGMRRD